MLDVCYFVHEWPRHITENGLRKSSFKISEKGEISYIRSYFCFGTTILCLILEPCKVQDILSKNLVSIMLKYIQEFFFF